MEKRITLPLTLETVKGLHAGDSCLLTGVIYTARDAAHKRLFELLEKGETLPLDVKDSTFYFVGPTPKKDGEVIGSAGPTTSYRMDAYSPTLIAKGQRGMIGKGSRSDEVVEAMKAYGAVYFGAIGGCGALLGKCIKSCELIAYEDLGTEAIHRLEVEDFPVTVVIDSYGSNLYQIGKARYLEDLKTKRDNNYIK